MNTKTKKMKRIWKDKEEEENEEENEEHEEDDGKVEMFSTNEIKSVYFHLTIIPSMFFLSGFK